jgi:hypothetical protein
MKKLLSILAFTFTIFISRGQVSYEVLNSEAVTKSIKGIAADNNGNTIITGNFNTTITFGGFTLTSNIEQTTCFVAKKLANGSFAWAKSIGLLSVTGSAGSAVEIYNVAIDAAGNCYITGNFRGKAVFDNIILTSVKNGADHTFDMFTAKISAAGATIWAKSEGNNNGAEFGRSVTVDNTGNVYATGQLNYSVFKNPVTCAPGYTTDASCAVVVKYTASGTKSWIKKFFNSQASATVCGGRVFGSNIRSDGTDVYVSGQMYGNVNFGGVSLNTGSNVISNSFLLKLNANGNTSWARFVTGSKNISYIVGDGLFVDPVTNEVYLSGVFYDSSITAGSCSLAYTSSFGYLARFSSAGNCSYVIPIWGINYGIVRLTNGNLAMMNRKCNMPACVWIEQRSALDGSVIDSIVATVDTGTGISYFSGLARTPDGFAFVHNLSGSYDFGGTTISSVGSHGFMLIRYTEPVSPGFRQASLKDEILSSGIVIYPNPAHDQIIIQGNTQAVPGDMVIYDVSGRQVYKGFLTQTKTVIDIKGFSPGSYYLRCGSYSSRFIKQ